MKKNLLFLFIGTLCFLPACTKQKGTNTAPESMDCNGIDSRFAAKVFPIIQGNCAIAGCHASGSNNGPGALTNFSQINSASARIKTAVSSGQMPKGGSLTGQDKNTILCWVSSGSANN